MKAHPAFKIFIDNQEVTNYLNYRADADKQWLASIFNFLSEYLNDSTSINVKTSGSTGTPKTISIDKIKMRNSALMTGEFLNLKEKNTALLCLSADYIAGKMMIVRALEIGLELHCIEPSSNLNIGKSLYDFCAMVPLQAQSNLGSLSRIKSLIIGGGIVSKTLEKELLNLNHQGLFQTFGMTETVSHIALKKVGKALYNVLPYISISISERGTLVIHAPKLLTEDLQTNDLIKIYDDKSFEWLGRIDNIINSGGLKISPEKIETEISKWIDFPVLVCGIKDEKLGEKLILIVESKKKIDLPDWNETDLTPYQTPKDTFFIDELVRTENGKIQRKQSIERFLETNF